jgi:hypothetical protein
VLLPSGDAPGGGGFVLNDRCEVVTWQYGVNVAPDVTAIDPATGGDLFVGSGIPAENFGVARNTDVGLELGFQVLYRQGPTVASADTYADGVLQFTVNDGPQSTANGSASNNVGRAAWNFTYSIATGLDGATSDLSDYAFQLLIDVDPGSGTSYRTLMLEREPSAQASGQSGYQWRDQETGVVLIADDEGNSQVTQNSQNYAFYAALTAPYVPPTFAGPAQFDLVLLALDGSQIVVRNHIVVNVTP